MEGTFITGQSPSPYNSDSNNYDYNNLVEQNSDYDAE
jgi:hypothetical protein